jgi:ornithine cyclodeaminase/alanine dehydrogenase-like protein (mu-crystallin family)
VVTATAAKAPVFDGHWLDQGTHVSGMGSNTPNKRELDGTVFNRSTIVVDFKEQALQEAGDLHDALRTGAISAEAVDIELGDVIAGKKPGRLHDLEITLFKSVGMAIEDIATAAFAYQRALAEGLGTQIDFEDSRVRAAPAALAQLVSEEGGPDAVV